MQIGADQFFRVHYIGQKEADAGEDVVLIVRPEFLKFAEIVQCDGHVTVARILQLKMRRGDAVVRREHLAHDWGRQAGGGHRHANQRQKQNLAGEHGLQNDSAVDFLNPEYAIAGFGDRVALGRQQGVNL